MDVLPSWKALLLMEGGPEFSQLKYGRPPWTIRRWSNFAIPSVAPLSRGRPRLLVERLYGPGMNTLFFFFFFLGLRVNILLVDLLRRLLFPKELPRVVFRMAGVVSLTSLLGPINRCIPFLAPHLFHNLLSYLVQEPRLVLVLDLSGIPSFFLGFRLKSLFLTCLRLVIV